MRDIIWTIIIIWVILKIIGAFRSFSSAKRKVHENSGHSQDYTQNTNQTHTSSTPKKGELKSDAGEYVDYEEIK